MTTDDKEKTRGGRFRYTNIQRAHEIGVYHFRERQRELKDDYPVAAIQLLEDSLSVHNSRTVYKDRFVEYLKSRFLVEEQLYTYYQHEIFRVHRWWSYQNKQRSESNLMKKIKEKFGEKCVLAYGDWSASQQMHGLIPSPTSGIRKKLEKHFQVISVQEYNTTKTCSKCKEKTMVAPFLKRRRKRNKEDDNDDGGREYSVQGIYHCKNDSCRVCSWAEITTPPSTSERISYTT